MIDEKAKLDFYVSNDVKCNAEEAMKLMLEKDLDIKYIIKFFNINPTSLAALCDSKDIVLTDEERDRVCVQKQKTTFEAYTEEETKKKKFLNP